MEWVAKSPDDLVFIAESILKSAGEEGIFLFYGEMGAGKTTLIKALCKNLQVEEEVKSPTFNLVNEYQSITGKTIYHFDFYRIDDVSEALDFGTDEYFSSGDLCLVEWPEKISEILPEPHHRINIQIEDNSRIISLISG